MIIVEAMPPSPGPLAIVRMKAGCSNTCRPGQTAGEEGRAGKLRVVQSLDKSAH